MDAYPLLHESRAARPPPGGAPSCSSAPSRTSTLTRAPYPPRRSPASSRAKEVRRVRGGRKGAIRPGDGPLRAHQQVRRHATRRPGLSPARAKELLGRFVPRGRRRTVACPLNLVEGEFCELRPERVLRGPEASVFLVPGPATFVGRRGPGTRCGPGKATHPEE